MRSLLVIGEQHQDSLPEILQNSGCDVEIVRDCRGAREALGRRPDLDVVLSDLSLSDGNWWTILREMVETDQSAKIIVCLPDAEGNGHSIRDLGAFDVLAPPFDPLQVRRMVRLAATENQPRMLMRPSQG